MNTTAPSRTARSVRALIAALGALLIGVALLAPPADAAAVPVVSDDFSGSELDPGWVVTDHVGDGSVELVGQGTGDAYLALSVGAGTSHDAWGVNRSLRVMQAVTVDDFAVDVGFDSVPAATNHDQGLIVEQDGSNWLRFDVFSSGGVVRAFAGATTNGSSKMRFNTVLSSQPSESVVIGVSRIGDSWTMTVAVDGGSPQVIGSFSHSLTVSAVGPFAANSGSNPAEYMALVDYVFDRATPIVPEDGGLDPDPDPDPDPEPDPDPDPEPDVTAPVVSGVSAVPTASSAVVSWQTDEPATGAVAYGTSPSYGSSASSSGSGTSHSVALTGLQPETTYHYRITATDTAGNTTVTGDDVFTTPAQVNGISIDVWHGASQTFGAPARTQQRVNIVGSVTNPEFVTSLTYTVNDGAPARLSMGPDNRRLAEPGDFNVDVPYSDLLVGANMIVITAVGADGSSMMESVDIFVEDGSLALPYTAAWAGDQSLQTQAQSVDGHWQVSDGSVRTEQVGYDRLLTVGDIAWTDYEVTVPMTVNAFGPGAYQYLSGAPMIGVGLRWQGHTQVNAEQPGYWWYPVGAYAWYRFYEDGQRWEVFGNNNTPSRRGPKDAFDFGVGDTYIMRVRVETLPTGGALYSMKMWEQGTAEPAGWSVTLTDDDSVSHGSVALIAHHVDATFGAVTVTPLQP